MFQLRFYCLDPDGKPDYVVDGEYVAIEHAQYRAEHSGSTWYFYPFPAVFVDGKFHSVLYTPSEASCANLMSDGLVIKNRLESLT